MKTALLAGLASFSLLAAPPARTADELRVIYPSGASIAFEEHEWSTLKGKEASMKINGEEASEEMQKGLQESLPSQREDKLVRFTTWLDEVEDGRPVEARRRFDELTRTAVEGEEETEEEGELSGRTVLLSGSADEEEVAARLPDDDEGGEVDEVYLANHRLVFELERYLPGREVAVGDTWELDEAAVREILGVDRKGPRYFESDTTDENEEMDRAMRDGVKVSGSVEYERREDVEGVSCAVLVLTLHADLSDADIDPAAMGMEEQEGLEASAKLSIQMEGEERLWFALEAGRPVRSQGEWKGEMEMEINMSNDDVGMEIEIGMVTDMRGGFEQSYAFDED